MIWPRLTPTQRNVRRSTRPQLPVPGSPRPERAWSSRQQGPHHQVGRQACSRRQEPPGHPVTKALRSARRCRQRDRAHRARLRQQMSRSKGRSPMPRRPHQHLRVAAYRRRARLPSHDRTRPHRRGWSRARSRTIVGLRNSRVFSVYFATATDRRRPSRTVLHRRREAGKSSRRARPQRTGAAALLLRQAWREPRRLSK